MVDLTIKIGKVTFSNPVFVASGTFGYGLEVEDLVDISDLGAIITKSITLHSRAGNPPPRIVETPSGMINSIGLANIGVDQYIKDMIPRFQQLSTPVIMSIAGATKDEYVQVLEKMESVSSNIVGYEINISCPNVDAGGMEFGISYDLTKELTSALRKRTDRLLIIKLSPNVTDIGLIGKAAEEAGADAVSAINTVVGMSINPDDWRSNIYTTFGGLSGPAVKPVGLVCVHKLSLKINIPVIGIGGITNANDVVEYALAGATAIQVGTANFRSPNAGIKILKELRCYLTNRNLKTFTSLMGRVKLHQ